MTASWRAAAACNPSNRSPGTTFAEWVGLWHPDDSYHADPVARDACRSCPVWVDCLEQSLVDTYQMPASTELVGMRALLSTKERRFVLQLRNREGWHRVDESCGCRACETVVEIRAGRRINSNGDGARCMRTSTYARGCKCRACRFAIALATRRRKVAA